MKSSTIRRSTLSKETMEVIENLAKEQEESGLPGEYVRPDEIEAASNSKDKDKDGDGSVSQEIDLLWQNFKTTQFNTNSPVINIMIGIVIGVAATLIVLAGISAFSNENSTPSGKAGAGIQKIFKHKDNAKEPTLEQQAAYEGQSEENQKVAIPSESEEAAAAAESEEKNVQKSEADTADTSKMTKYIVRNGDTVEKIIKNHYGSYSPEKAEMVRKANNLQTLDRINIDQELLLP